jgi:hypothetical protein
MAEALGRAGQKAEGLAAINCSSAAFSAKRCAVRSNSTNNSPWRFCKRATCQRGDVITGLRLLRAGFDEFGEPGSVVSRLVAF